MIHLQVFFAILCGIGWIMLSIISLRMNRSLHNISAGIYFNFGFSVLWTNTCIWSRVLDFEKKRTQFNGNCSNKEHSNSNYKNGSNVQSAFIKKGLQYFRYKKICCSLTVVLFFITLILGRALNFSSPDSTYYHYAGPCLQYFSVSILSFFLCTLHLDLQIGFLGSTYFESMK